MRKKMKRLSLLFSAIMLMMILAGCSAKTAASIPSSAAAYKHIDQETAKEMMKADDGHVIVDVRRQDEYDAGHIPGAILIPNESIGCDSPEALPDYDQVILIYCRSGNRSKQAAQKLASMGYTNIYEFGGIIDWTATVVTTEEEASVSTTTASLCFSSFSGGGYEYSVEIDDPSIVSWEARYEFEANAEELDGASYDYIISFTGLKPGTTTIAVYGRSPILEDENSVYTVSVDEALQVTLTQVQRLSTFFIYRNGDINYDSYQIKLDSDGYHVSINEEPEVPVSTGIVNLLMDVIDRYNVAAWDGFSESEKNVLDGEGFWLDFTLTDGTKVQARGDNVFPEHYFEAMNAIWEILEQIKEETKVEHMNTIYLAGGCFWGREYCRSCGRRLCDCNSVEKAGDDFRAGYGR